MASSQQTPNYLLPQFIAEDKPGWLTDWNYAMLRIDNIMQANHADIVKLNTRVTALEEGGAGGGTYDFDQLQNRPKYNDEEMTSNTNIPDLSAEVENNKTSIETETTQRVSADNELQQQIDALVSKSDVVDTVATYTDLQAYDTSTLAVKDVVIVLQDSTHEDGTSYYRWSDPTADEWNFIGTLAPGYTKAEADSRFVNKENFIITEQGQTRANNLPGSLITAVTASATATQVQLNNTRLSLITGQLSAQTINMPMASDTQAGGVTAEHMGKILNGVRYNGNFANESTIKPPSVGFTNFASIANSSPINTLCIGMIRIRFVFTNIPTSEHYFSLILRSESTSIGIAPIITRPNSKTQDQNVLVYGLKPNNSNTLYIGLQDVNPDESNPVTGTPLVDQCILLTT